MGLFRWVGRKIERRRSDRAIENMADAEARLRLQRMFAPTNLAEDIVNEFKNYVIEARAGRFTIPAIEREFQEPRASVRDIWIDTRTESFGPLVLRGQDWGHLTQLPFQPDLMTGRGDQLQPTFHAAWQCVLYADKAAMKVGVRNAEIDGVGERFEQRLKEGQAWWQENPPDEEIYRMLVDGERPPYLIFLMWDEITRATKDIAYARTFGPSWESGVSLLMEKLSACDPASVDQPASHEPNMLERMRAAINPDDLLPPKRAT